MKTNRILSHKKNISPVVRVSRRQVGDNRVLLLYVHAGGRCQFRGCGDYLLKHPLTLKVANFGEVAHVVAFRETGPRGTSLPRPKDIHDPSNLMLLCHTCHRLIDTEPSDYPSTLLQEMKAEHEKNVYEATGIKKNQRTAIVRLEAPINGRQASIPLPIVYRAILPRHPLEKPTCHIPLNAQTAISADDEFIAAAARTIDAKVKDFLAPGLGGEQVEHISVFGLAPISLLILLGHRLGNTIPADVYHHHHDTEDWTWKTASRRAEFEHRLLRRGARRDCVALLVSISGTVETASLPSQIDKKFWLYEIRPKGMKSDTNCLKTRECLENFKRVYEEWLREVRRKHYPLGEIHVFPAVPPPVAILCGRELMPKVDPALRVYDYNKTRQGFGFSLEVNSNDN